MPKKKNLMLKEHINQYLRPDTSYSVLCQCRICVIWYLTSHFKLQFFKNCECRSHLGCDANFSLFEILAYFYYYSGSTALFGLTPFLHFQEKKKNSVSAKISCYQTEPHVVLRSILSREKHGL